ncbi:MAG: hypothetical protein QM808_09110 [Steroidobacteraceae bacterium]
MKYAAIVALLSATPVLAANQYDPPINSTVELLEWCQQESQATLIGKGDKPFNWTASQWDSADTLFVKGSWRSGVKEVVVECRVGKGAKRSYASISIHDPK